MKYLGLNNITRSVDICDSYLWKHFSLTDWLIGVSARMMQSNASNLIWLDKHRSVWKCETISDSSKSNTAWQVPKLKCALDMTMCLLQHISYKIWENSLLFKSTLQWILILTNRKVLLQKALTKADKGQGKLLTKGNDFSHRSFNWVSSISRRGKF